MKFFFSYILWCLSFSLSTIAFSQTKVNSKILVWEDSLKSLGNDIFQNIEEPERIAANFNFVKTLVVALKEVHSFEYDFPSLKMISIIKSPKKDFRIFSWNVPLNDGSYLYYGSIQFKTADGSLKLLPLLDKTFEIKEVEKDVLTNQSWYGAQYYELNPINDNTYVLLGWKGHTPDYTQKVIDIVTIKDGAVTFGAKLFSDDATITRKIFRYTREATMILKYESNNKKIVFDHIVPADSSLKGNFKYYGPDLSYDAYEIKDGKLNFQSNIKLMNPTRGDEDQYLDPTKKVNSKKTGIQ